MTSQVASKKTNEILHRRRLRLQQVREQSKEIAKKIRQRANVETLRQLKEVNEEKAKHYLDCQKQFVNQLQELYKKGIDDVGAGHKDASKQGQQEIDKKNDKSKLRGIEAAAALRKKRQEILDKQKQLLDRKLQARDTANERSREKSNIIAKSLHDQGSDAESNNKEVQGTNKLTCVNKVDMGTQLNYEDPLNDGQVDIPALLLPESNTVIDTATDQLDNIENIKKPNLFALSEEMPSSLRGGTSNIYEEVAQYKPSLTLVSEFIQNRRFRLRENVPSVNRKETDNLDSIKQTIQKTRASKTEEQGSSKSSGKVSNSECSKKGSIVMYNHLTRDVRTVPLSDENLVIRNIHTDDNAFSKAQKQETNDNLKQKELQKKLADERNKVAMTKEHVDKEYRDTLAFLNSLPKDMSSKPNKAMYMDEKRQQQFKVNRERRLQQAFKNIEKECKTQKCKHSKAQSPCRSESSDQIVEEVNEDRTDYSWMPVPDKDENLAIHSIPTNRKTVSHGNTVKFSNDNAYHEYRSRHKHTPPTKDAPNRLRPSKSKYVETVLIEQNGSESTDCTSIASDSSSMDTVSNRPEKRESSKEYKETRSETDRIIIYKILDSRNDKHKKCHRKSKLCDKNRNNAECNEQKGGSSAFVAHQANHDTVKTHDKVKKASFEQMEEGVYRMVEGKGDNIASLEIADNPKSFKGKPNNYNHNAGSKCCQCSKENTKDADSKGVQANSINTGSIAQICSCTTAKNNPEMQSIHYPSAATSTSSLRTDASKVNVIPSDGTCIKLLDEGSQESGKFFVGTTGFLKNEAYEVIIQLRKKESSDKEGESSRKRDEFTNNVKDTEAKGDEKQSDKLDVSVQADNLVNKTSEIVDKGSEDNRPTSHSAQPVCPSKSDDGQSNIERQSPLLKDQATSINKSDNISPRPYPVPNQATSTYTQTTSSPVHRPIFMHMSSSTSTAYMSPPEVIIPRFLKRDCPISYDETCDSNTLNDPPNLTRELCTCKLHVRKRNKSHRAKTSSKCKKISSTQNSGSSVGGPRDHTNKIYETLPPNYAFKKHHTCKKIRNESKRYRQDNQIKSFTAKVTSNSPLYDIGLPFNKNMKSFQSQNLRTNSKTALNPLIKAYVHELLQLNKEGMKAVEIINQDCSTVPTPTSSIINNNLNVNNNLLDEKKISLEQIKNILRQKIVSSCDTNNDIPRKHPPSIDKGKRKISKTRPKLQRKQLHKVKSLNISRKLATIKPVSISKECETKNTVKQTSTSSSCKNNSCDQIDFPANKKQQCDPKKIIPSQKSGKVTRHKEFKYKKAKSDTEAPKSVTTSFTTDSEIIPVNKYTKRVHLRPAHTSTQTSKNFDCDNNFIRVAEDKLQNMEKIADLTEKCTKRLSNLAKVLEEVRRNKSLAYSQITSSESTSDSDLERNKIKTRSPPVDYVDEKSSYNKMSSLTITSEEEKHKAVPGIETFIPLLTDIPKPSDFKTPLPVVSKLSTSSNNENTNIVMDSFKLRAKPPPALSRIHLKNGQEQIVPHELSTVLEVDSPMSLKLKSKSKTDLQGDLGTKSTDSVESMTSNNEGINNLLISSLNNKATDQRLPSKNLNTRNKNSVNFDSSDDSKLQMMDLKEFNEIMLKPFISLQEYAKNKNIQAFDDASTVDNNIKDAPPNEELSSLHSDSSLPDVVAELLKRKIINEPFKFDTASNVNSSSLSTESTISLLALSNSRQDRKQTRFQKHASEISDTLSISSNPDLEHAFQKIGMGWASSTLKKTKERLALSSSSNTSSSSGLQHRNKNANYPATMTTVPIVLLSSREKSPRKRHNVSEVVKKGEPRTSLPNSMTVKEFLTNELAKKITFSNKSTKDVTDQEFVSLYETRMPDEMKQMTRVDDQSATSLANLTSNNRARTSTPVQIFRSMTYHSSSSTNTSNGLFSNADDLSSVKVTSNSIRNHSTSDKDDLTIPSYTLKKSKAHSEGSKSDN